MIPKIIHYVWFGSKKKKRLIRRCMRSWAKACPDYKIVLWDERNFDVNRYEFTREAYERKSWAFLSDFIRVYALKEYGGIYLDTDVEIIKSLDSLLVNKAFVGFEDNEKIGTAIIGSEAQNPIFDNLFKLYKTKHFINSNGASDLTPNVHLFTDELSQHGLKIDNSFQKLNDITIFPKDYFYPKNYITSKINLTDNTVCIHHYLGSWCTTKSKIIKFLPPKVTKYIVKIKHLFKK